MSKFLLDANLSPETREYLDKTFHFDTIDLLTEGKSDFSDDQVVDFAKNEHRVIITFDQDFGEIYYLKERGSIGAIVLKTRGSNCRVCQPNPW